MMTFLIILGIIFLVIILLWLGLFGLFVELLCAIFGGGSGGSGSSGGGSFGGGDFGGGGSSDDY